MAKYCVNKNAQSNGDHEVHNIDARCRFLPDIANRLALGSHLTCTTAVAKAKQTYRQSNGCYYCARACHTR